MSTTIFVPSSSRKLKLNSHFNFRAARSVHYLGAVHFYLHRPRFILFAISRARGDFPVHATASCPTSRARRASQRRGP